MLAKQPCDLQQPRKSAPVLSHNPACPATFLTHSSLKELCTHSWSQPPSHMRHTSQLSFVSKASCFILDPPHTSVLTRTAEQSQASRHSAPARDTNETSLQAGAAAKLPAWVLAGYGCFYSSTAWNFLVNTQTSFLFLFRCCKIGG